jgi:type II restriction enzyme
MTMKMNPTKAKSALDKIIRKSRVHLYKPIQIAEILYHNRQGLVSVDDLENYRNPSKRWRDEVSMLLVGRHSTSSQKFQDNLFEENAMPPSLLSQLADFNVETGGLAEAYVYRHLERKLQSVHKIHEYIQHSDPTSFRLRLLLGLLTESPGLRRSIDKAYEITVYALFSTLVRALKVNVKVSVGNKDREILKDFANFLAVALGLPVGETEYSFPASLYRGGVTNAADRGLDMISNFGPVVQVKHLVLDGELAGEIIESIAAERVVIVCLASEKKLIMNILAQLGMAERIQGIVTLDDLDSWYQLCLGAKYRQSLGKNLLQDLEREFQNEFPTCEQIAPFLKKRGYDRIRLPSGWSVADI